MADLALKLNIEVDSNFCPSAMIGRTSCSRPTLRLSLKCQFCQPPTAAAASSLASSH